MMQTYRAALDAITAESGIAETNILDIRGNHDVFSLASRCEGTLYTCHQKKTRARRSDDLMPVWPDCSGVAQRTSFQCTRLPAGAMTPPVCARMRCMLHLMALADIPHRCGLQHSESKIQRDPV